MSWSPYYPQGWKTGGGGATPISAEALNHFDDGIKDAHDTLDGHVGEPLGQQNTHPMPFLFSAGVYTGDGTEGRRIEIGFVPQYVRIIASAAEAIRENSYYMFDVTSSTAWAHMADITTPTSGLYRNPVERTAGISIDGTGVSVGYRTAGGGGNSTGLTYHWFAWGVAQ